MEKLDYKKEYKDLYQPAAKPSLIDVPEMIFFAVDGEETPTPVPPTRRLWKCCTGCPLP